MQLKLQDTDLNYLSVHLGLAISRNKRFKRLLTNHSINADVKETFNLCSLYRINLLKYLGQDSDDCRIQSGCDPKSPIIRKL